MTDETPDFLLEAREALEKGHAFDDIILHVYATAAARGLKVGREEEDTCKENAENITRSENVLNKCENVDTLEALQCLYEDAMVTHTFDPYGMQECERLFKLVQKVLRQTDYLATSGLKEISAAYSPNEQDYAGYGHLKLIKRCIEEGGL